MKKILILTVAIFLLIQASAYADTLEKEGSNPYDIVKSDGTIIKYQDYIVEVEGNSALDTLISTKKEPSKNIKLKKKTQENIVFSNSINVDEIFELDPSKPLLFNEIDNTSNYNDNILSPYVVIGEDGRKKVSDTTITPFRNITLIMMEWDDAYGVCTGTVVAPGNQVLTNAHCLIDDELGRPIAIQVAPGVRNNQAYFGLYDAKETFIPSGYIPGGNDSSRFDYGIIKTEGTVGEYVGFLPIKEVTNTMGINISVTGYPGDLNTHDYSQWGMSGSVETETSTLAFYRGIDTAGGQSGSAMLNTSNQIVGVHNGAYQLAADNGDRITFNGGPKMIKPVVDFIKYTMTQ